MPSILDPLKPSPPPSISSSIQHQRLCSHHSHSHHHLSIRRIRPQYIFRGFAVLLGILYIFLTTRIHMFVNEDERQEKQVQPLAGATRKTGSTSTTTTTLSVLLPPTSSSLSSFSSLKKKKTKAKISSSVQQQQRAFVKDDGIINQSSFSSTMTTKEEEGVIVKTTTTWEVPKIQKQRPKLLLQEKLDASFHETGIFYQGDLWDLSDYIPQWMKDYFIWHRIERARFTEDTWMSGPQVMVMQCLRGYDTRCGGTADRLKGFLCAVREAYLSRRLLFIHWTLPARLEEFLLPPLHSIDWRVPDWFSTILHKRAASAYYHDRYVFKFRILKSIRHDNRTHLLRTRLQSTTGGAQQYDDELLPGESTFAELYHDVWRIFFTPSPPIRSAVESYIAKWKIHPGEYISTHIRALYVPNANRTEKTMIDWVENALNCASHLRPGGPYFFSSDYTFSTEAAIAYGISQHVDVFSRVHDSLPLHLDQADDILNRNPSDFYDTFIDLYLMALSRCVTYNRGGFGQWALLIGYNSSCSHNIKTSSAGIAAPCDWVSTTTTTTTTSGTKRHNTHKKKESSRIAPLFLPPITDQEVSGNLSERQLTPFSKQPLPLWMIEYFEWHRKTRAELTPDNWNQTKYLVMGCKKSTKNCGGISDRLKPLPFVILQAARHRRLLFITWIRPKPLEEFLEPPLGGVDWRMPSFLKPFLRKLESIPDISRSVGDLNRKMYVKANDILIDVTIQNADGGELAYSEQPDSFSTYQDVFHGLFRTFFIPVPRLQATIDVTMKNHGIYPNQYAAVHHRNMYGNRIWRHPNETISIVMNGIHCATNLYPGAPIFFAADDKFAVHVAREYGQQRNFSIATLDGLQKNEEEEKDPIHLDKDDDWKNRTASEYDDTFLDLYLLGNAKCVTYSNGGYGSFGSLLSFDPTCKIRYFRIRDMEQNCTFLNEYNETILLDPPILNLSAEMYIDPRKK